MTDGHLVVLKADNEGQHAIVNAVHLKEIGGIWSICGVNNDTEIALGTVTGLHIATIGARTITRTHEHYMKGKNIWNVSEYDDNKLICSQWSMPHLYMIDRQTDQKMKKIVEIKDLDSANKCITDLMPLPAYDPVEFPFFIKRGLKKVTLVDIVNKKNYTMYEDTNNKWGYNKISIIDRGEGRFNLLFVVNETKNK